MRRWLVEKRPGKTEVEDGVGWLGILVLEAVLGNAVEEAPGSFGHGWTIRPDRRGGENG